jgi:CRP-like cAMP-binding protein
MRHRNFKAGDVLFRKGDAVDRLIYVAEGKLKLPEIGITIGTGELLGEIGLFAPDKMRTHTLVCETDGELYEMSDETLFQLYYQNPRLGFYMMRLIAARLLGDVRRPHTPPIAV